MCVCQSIFFFDAARKKKHKHGGMMWMSGLAMAAMFAQVVLGKVALIASAALILAKIALFVSTTVMWHSII